MPLVILVGTPCSGKTRRARELKEYFDQRGKKVDIISEEEVIQKLGYDKNETYLDAQKEKKVRGILKSEVIRLIGKDNVIILDGSNYIKGFRYELYCASKASKSTQCTVYTIRNHDDAEQANKERQRLLEDISKNVKSLNICDKDGTSEDAEKGNGVERGITKIVAEETPYTDEVFEALTKFRFEEPHSQHRWDSPLFTVQPPDELDTAALYQALFLKKPPPPNMSTQNPPLSATNFLYDLDRMTQSINSQLLEAKRSGSSFLPEHPDCGVTPELLECVTSQKLNAYRRQFLTFAKQQAKNSDVVTPRYYVSFLSTLIHQ